MCHQKGWATNTVYVSRWYSVYNYCSMSLNSQAKFECEFWFPQISNILPSSPRKYRVVGEGGGNAGKGGATRFAILR